MNNAISIGIDNRDGVYFAARVDRHTGRPEVKALMRFDADHFNGHHLLEGGQIVVSIPEEQIMLKKIHLSNNENSILKAQFELSQSLLDDPDQFVFDTIETELDSYYLGLIIRKEILKQNVDPFIRQNGDQTISVKATIRAAALARGFLIFCRNNTSDLGAVVDFNKNSASIAFFYKQKIIDLVGFPTAKYDLTNQESLQNMGVELKTILNFKLSSFFENGITLPLSTLYALGEDMDSDSVKLLQEQLKIEVIRPEVNTGFLANRQNSSDIPLEKYLVALGLTVD